MRNRMVAQNLAKSTIDGYVYGVRQLAAFYKKNFDEIESEDIYAFLVYLREERGLSRETMRIAVCGIKYLYKHLLNRKDIVEEIPYPKKEKYLPEILNSNELLKLFNRTSNIKHRVFLKLVYSAGVRRREACNIRLTDIDSKNNQIRIHQGKGKKDRYVPLSQNVLQEARLYVKQVRPEVYLFNGRTKGKPISNESSAWIMEKAVARAGITKKVSLHNLRHSFASHLLSMGVNLVTIQQLLGHEDIRTTMIYLHINCIYQKPFTNPLDLLYPGKNNGGK
jgi:integrase/recombinase XerD